MLYGTTSAGGGGNCVKYSPAGCGTIFQISTTGSNYARLHAFKDPARDGYQPWGGLTVEGSRLYGTTVFGGGTNNSGRGEGIVFGIALTGKNYKILHEFKAGSNDGAIPQSSLTVVDGMLYGTTVYGGPGNGKDGFGTIFQIDPTGSNFKVLYAFKSGTDGAFSTAGLLAYKGVLYGAAVNGGSSSQAGTIFKIAPSGSGYKTLYTFTGDPDGANPQAGLVENDGIFYGTTVSGGQPGDACFAGGCGTIYRVNTSGAETVLFDFNADTTGASPYAGLIAEQNVLYGTAPMGIVGAGGGLVFSLSRVLGSPGSAPLDMNSISIPKAIRSCYPQWSQHLSPLVCTQLR